MTTSAIVTMVIGMLIIWGGLTASVLHAVRVGRAARADAAAAERSRPEE